MQIKTIEGGCLCGAVRYQATGTPRDLTHCHCTQCRKASGAAFVSWASFDTHHFAFPKGSPSHYRSSPMAERGFCSQCGTALTFQYLEKQHEIDVTLCSMDHPEELVPRDHIWTSSQLPWIQFADGLPSFTRKRHE